MSSGRSLRLRPDIEDQQSHEEHSVSVRKSLSAQSRDASVGSEGRPDLGRTSFSSQKLDSVKEKSLKETGVAKVPKIWTSNPNNLQNLRPRVASLGVSASKPSVLSPSGSLKKALDLDSRPLSLIPAINQSLHTPIEEINDHLEHPNLQMHPTDLQEIRLKNPRREQRFITFSPEAALPNTHNMQLQEPLATFQTLDAEHEKVSPAQPKLAVSLAEDIETMLRDYFSMDIKGVRTLITQVSAEEQFGHAITTITKNNNNNVLEVNPAARNILDGLQLDEHVSFGDCLGRLLREKDIKDIDLGHLLGDHQDDGHGFKSSADRKSMTGHDYLELSETGSIDSDSFPTVCHNETGEAPVLSSGLFRSATNRSTLGQETQQNASFLRVATFL